MSFYEYTKPIAAANGIKSRSRGGANWWSRRWLELLDVCIDSGRMSRGRSYARKGQVLDIEITEGLIAATVQGSRRTPYIVRMAFDTLSSDEMEYFIMQCRENISVAASLLAGELPETIESIFAELPAPLFLTRREIRKFKCTCPDDAVPCKHIVAVLVLVAEVIDSDPFLLLKLRGIDREMLLNVLTNEHFDEAEDFSDSDSCEYEQEDDCSVSGGSECETAEEETDLSRWFKAGEFTFEETGSRNTRTHAALDVICDFPFWRGEVPFRTALMPMYERAAVNAAEIITGERIKAIGRPRKLK